jgi:hypothetical protein
VCALYGNSNEDIYEGAAELALVTLPIPAVVAVVEVEQSPRLQARSLYAMHPPCTLDSLLGVSVLNPPPPPKPRPFLPLVPLAATSVLD